MVCLLPCFSFSSSQISLHRFFVPQNFRTLSSVFLCGWHCHCHRAMIPLILDRCRILSPRVCPPFKYWCMTRTIRYLRASPRRPRRNFAGVSFLALLLILDLGFYALAVSKCRNASQASMEETLRELKGAVITLVCYSASSFLLTFHSFRYICEWRRRIRPCVCPALPHPRPRPARPSARHVGFFSVSYSQEL